jgi:hypothetical protein
MLLQWNAGDPRAKLVAALLAAPGEQSDSGTIADVDVELNLKRWGAPLLRAGSARRDLPLEETVARGLALARRNATVAQVLPIVLAKHRRSVDLFRLKELSTASGQKRTLGFYLSLCARLSNEDCWKGAAGSLLDRRVRRIEDFFLTSQGPRARRLADRNTPPLARRWRFRMNLPMHSFESTYRKYM